MKLKVSIISLAALLTLPTRLAFGLSFYENSIRRGPLPNEEVLSSIVKFYRDDADLSLNAPGCTGFFVESDLESAFVLTARHCHPYSITQWCKDGGKVREYGSGDLRTCLDVPVDDSRTDMALLKVSGGKPKTTLKLALFPPAVDARVVMYGYPTDPAAKPGLNVTENCWIRNQNGSKTRPSDEKFKNIYFDAHFRHNCSTWGGNSGGPMVLEGTRIAIGMPWEYSSTETQQNSSFISEGSDGIMTATFVSQFIEKLEALKIAPAIHKSAHPLKSPSAISVRSGQYANEACMPGWMAVIQAAYNTTDSLQRLKTFWINGSTSRAYEATCKDGECTHENGSRFRVVPGHPWELDYFFDSTPGTSACRLKGIYTAPF